ncbi:hypothetical protein QBC46DRAFT_274278, partial [Diplogelasinospora grovesii]
LLLDGPYRQEIGLQSFKMAILAAKGNGIFRVLSFALDLLDRHKHALSANKIRRVNIL